MNILHRIEDLRNITGECLARAYDTLDKNGPFSESSLAAVWLSELRQAGQFYHDGWYAPPPHGIICTAGKQSESFAALNQDSFRKESTWPKADRIFNDDDILLAYASPIDHRTNLIGDFGINIYRGNDTQIRAHLENVLHTTLFVAAHAKADMPFCDLYEYALQHGKKAGLSSANVKSITDANDTNIGHTIPLSFSHDPASQKIPYAKSYDDIKEIIRTGRKFINSQQTQTIEENMAFVIEPKFSSENMPDILFHMTVIFENGEKRICHGYKSIFEMTGQDYLEKLLP